MKVLVIATHGTEESELVGTTSLLKRAGVSSSILSISKEPYIEGSHGTKILVDYNISSILKDVIKGFDALFLPGGGRGSKHISENEEALEIVRNFNDLGKPIYAICGAPSILGFAGIMKNRKFTCYDSFEQYIKDGIYVKGQDVVKDANIITGRSVNYVTEFALMIIESLVSKDVADKVKKAILRR